MKRCTPENRATYEDDLYRQMRNTGWFGVIVLAGGFVAAMLIAFT